MLYLLKKEDIHWVRPDLALSLGQRMGFQVRIRYRQPLQKAHFVLDKQWVIHPF